MKRTLALFMAALLASPGCAARLASGRLSPLAYAKRISAGQRPQAPRPEDEAAWERYLRTLPPGVPVKVRTLDGGSFKGTLLEVEAHRVNVKPRSRIPEPIRSIPLASLASLEIDQGPSMGKIVAVAAVTAGATVLAIFLVLMSLD